MKKRKKAKSGYRDWLRALLLALLLLWLFRVFVAQTFSVNSTSMSPNLFPGDIILVNKTIYGGRLPITLLAIPFTHNQFPFLPAIKPFLELLELPYLRFWPLGRFSRGDIAVLNKPSAHFPVDKGTHIAKRIVGLPGDTLEMRNGELLVNHQALSGEFQLYHNYELRTSNTPPADFFSSKGIQEGGAVFKSLNFRFHMSSLQAGNLKKESIVTSLMRIVIPSDSIDSTMFQSGRRISNADYFPPLVLPRKGDSLDKHTEDSFYYDLLRLYEPETLDLPPGQARVKHNYYFFLGDNRGNSADSRHWGAVPEKYIVGKATCILFAVPVKYRPDSWFRRLFHSLT